MTIERARIRSVGFMIVLLAATTLAATAARGQGVPYREALDGFIGRNYGAFLTLVLRPLPLETEGGPIGGFVVDAGQLALEIPNDVREEFERARKFFDEGRDLEAVARIENVLDHVPDFYKAHEALGMSYIRLRRFDDARDALVRAHELSPASPGPLMNLGTALYRKGESLEAAGESSAAPESIHRNGIEEMRGQGQIEARLADPAPGED